MTTEQQEDGITINEKQESIEVGTEPKVVLDESDPRAAIYAKHKEQRQAEGDGTPVGLSPDAPKQEAAPPADEQAPDEMVTVKVNGREKKVSKAKVEQAGGLDVYQKRLAAEEDLRMAKEERRRVQEYEQQLAAKAQELQRIEQEISKRAVQQPAAAPPDQGELKQLAKQYHEAILNGDIDQADELLLKINGARTATPQIDAEGIARRAAAEAKAALQAERQREQQQVFEAERQEAVARFEEEFSDIAENPDLRDFADQKTLKIMRENPSWRPAKIIEEAARQVREALGKTAPPPSSREEAKRNITTVRAASVRNQPKPQPKPPTSSQYVENLRKARGLE